MSNDIERIKSFIEEEMEMIREQVKSNDLTDRQIDEALNHYAPLKRVAIKIEEMERERNDRTSRIL